ncbi:MAG: superoxide dismutase family protein [Gemmatimonadota bacterium]
MDLWHLSLAPFVLLLACGKGAGSADPVAGFPIVASSGDTLGSIELEQKTGFVVLHLKAHDLPAGLHGMHLHANGICTPPDFKTAGGHFNPLGKQHGRLNPAGAHAGDLPNLTVSSSGTAKADLVLTTIARAELLGSAGAALVIHASPDDEKTDPSGNSGDRIACAVLKH